MVERASEEHASEIDASAAMQRLRDIGQGHVADAAEAAGAGAISAIAEQLNRLDKQYSGGMGTYIKNARGLLADARDGKNPLEGFMPRVPAGQTLKHGTKEFVTAEALGMSEMAGACFVLVAGGLGERLGYSGIKLELPTELATSTCFLGLYCSTILALQARARVAVGNDSLELPLCIMVSGDTEAGTRALLAKHNLFGMTERQVSIIRQELVPALVDADARFALTEGPDGLPRIACKPHGHGDVHALLHTSGLAGRWRDEGRRWAVFLQDTNGVVFHAIPAAIGMSAAQGWAVNSIAIPRRAGEAVGGICRLEKVPGAAAGGVVGAREGGVGAAGGAGEEKPADDAAGAAAGGTSQQADGQGDEDKEEQAAKGDEGQGEAAAADMGITINIEYNQLDPMLRATTGMGDMAVDRVSGLSPYPGNINALVLDVGRYAEVLEATQGAVPEFVNPKYKDETRQAFKKPARLECMMQDYPKLLAGRSGGHTVGFTTFDRWVAKSAVKNNINDAVTKQAKTGIAESAATGEAGIYKAWRHMLASAGVRVDCEGPRSAFAGVAVEGGAQIVLAPSTAVTQAEVAQQFSGGGDISISARSTLVVEGDVHFESLHLDGALVIRATPGAKVVVRGLRVRNRGWLREALPEHDSDPSAGEGAVAGDTAGPSEGADGASAGEVGDGGGQEDTKPPEHERMRGFRLRRLATAEYRFDEPGEHFLGSSTGIARGAVMRGWLDKQSAVLKLRRRRFLVLYPYGIYSFHAETDGADKSQATVAVPFDGQVEVRQVSDLRFQVLAPDQTITLTAQTNEDARAWLSAIAQCVRSSIPIAPQVRGTLYVFPISGSCFGVMALARHLGLEVKFEEVTLNQEGLPETDTESFRSMNPMQTVPVYRDSKGWCLWEGNAIMRFFAEGSDLMPGTPEGRAQMSLALDFRNTTLIEAMSMLAYPVFGFLPAFGAEEDKRRRMKHALDALFHSEHFFQSPVTTRSGSNSGVGAEVDARAGAEASGAEGGGESGGGKARARVAWAGSRFVSGDRLSVADFGIWSVLKFLAGSRAYDMPPEAMDYITRVEAASPACVEACKAYERFVEKQHGRVAHRSSAATAPDTDARSLSPSDVSDARPPSQDGGAVPTESSSTGRPETEAASVEGNADDQGDGTVRN